MSTSVNDPNKNSYPEDDGLVEDMMNENFSKILKVQICFKFGQSLVVSKSVSGVRKSLKNRNRCHLFRWIEIGAIYLYWIEIDDYYGSSKK